MKIIHLNYSDSSGGAARAAYRLHRAQLSSGLDSQMWVSDAKLGDLTVCGPRTKFEKFSPLLRSQLGLQLNSLQSTQNKILHSAQILPSRWVKKINESEANIVQLHWVQAEMLSIADIPKLTKPLVWLLHDMWAFSGAEHVSWDNRWREGYLANNRPTEDTGFDLNRWVWRRKVAKWKKPIQIVTPSGWLADCVRESVLMRTWPVEVIPNTIDTEFWKPIEKKIARELCGFSNCKRLLLFGAFGRTNEYHKGFDLLIKALIALKDSKRLDNLELVVLGQSSANQSDMLPFKTHFLGHLHDDLSLRLIYSAADAVVIPSRCDNLPNMGVESLSCGVPLIAFNACGLPDLIVHQKTGFLADAFDPLSLATGISWVLESSEYRKLSIASREFAVARFSHEVIVGRYANLYQSLL